MKLKDFRWSTGLFLILSPLGAAAVIGYYVYYEAFRWETLALAVFMMFATGMGITAGYHRLFSHKSYEAAAPIRWLLTFFGAGALEKSVIEWSHDHRNHHRYVDTDTDPYSINKGFFHAHIGWLFVKRGTNGRAQVDINQVKDLWADPFIRFQHKYYTAFGLFVCFLFPGLVALAW
ncbi:MAG: acyl-CoA desaturase, partial [Leptospiraceae bacterium]|nr:acyl-CoA desaturase [Leptospiraceae bacterium]